MTVPVHRRGENKLQAYKDTVAMTSYTLQMCENQKIFPKKCRWTICTKLIDYCLDSIIKIQQANTIKGTTPDEAKLRLKLQREILYNFQALWALMTVAYETYSIPSAKVDIWSQLMLTADNRVSAWRKYDMDRFKKVFGKNTN